jgi:tRNA 2-thiouridine synthesizing protein A
MADHVTVDTRGMKCPLPVLKARKALKELDAGGSMHVFATDPGAVKDFEHFCQVTGAVLIDCREEAGGVLVFHLKKAS